MEMQSPLKGLVDVQYLVFRELNPIALVSRVIKNINTASVCQIKLVVKPINSGALETKLRQVAAFNFLATE